MELAFVFPVGFIMDLLFFKISYMTVERTEFTRTKDGWAVRQRERKL